MDNKEQNILNCVLTTKSEEDQKSRSVVFPETSKEKAGKIKNDAENQKQKSFT